MPAPLRGMLPGAHSCCEDLVGLGEDPSLAAAMPCNPGPIISQFGPQFPLYFLKKGLDQVVQSSLWC